MIYLRWDKNLFLASKGTKNIRSRTRKFNDKELLIGSKEEKRLVIIII
jgi:hypothetical protein